VPARDVPDHLEVRPGYLHGVLKEPPEELVLVDRGIDHVPYGEGRNERLPEHHDVGALLLCLPDELVQLIDGGIPVKEDGRGLHRYSPELRINVARSAGIKISPPLYLSDIPNNAI